MGFAREIETQLEAFAMGAHFAEASQRLVDIWTCDGLGLEAVEPILRFMELHPDIDYGSPGALVHFMERFYGQGYEEALLASVARRPTEHTTWLLNRLINGEQEPSAKGMLVNAMHGIAAHPEADELTLRRAYHFLGLKA